MHPGFASCRFLLSTAIVLVFGSPAVYSAAPDLDRTVLLATNSADLKQGVTIVRGDVVVNAPSPGATLNPGFELVIGTGVSTPAGYLVLADSLRVKTNAAVACDDVAPADGICDNVYCNDLTDNSGTVSCQALGTAPVLDPLPPFVEAEERPGAADVTVESGQVHELAPGDYRNVVVKKNGAIHFAGGIYTLRSLASGPNSELLFAAPSEVRIAGRLSTDQNAVVGPADGSGVGASEIIFYVAGVNGNSGAIGSSPKAAEIGLRNVFDANVYAPHGTLWLRQFADCAGAFIARDVVLDVGARVTLANYFNPAPTAYPQTVFTSGTDPLLISLSGSDPENEPLTFSIVSAPNHGILSNVVQDPPAGATVTYTASQAGDLEDSFVFRVTDPSGATDEARVSINPVDGGQPPTPLAEVIAQDGAFEAVREEPTTLTLIAVAPCDATGAADPAVPCDGVGNDVPLTFSIVGGPGHGDLEDLTQGSEVPRRSATVTYTSDDLGFTGTDSFTFEACGDLDDNGDTAGPGECDTATVTVQVHEPVAPSAPVAPDLQFSTPPDTAVTIGLDGEPGDVTPQPRAARTPAGAGPATLARRSAATSDNGGRGSASGLVKAATAIAVDAGWSATTTVPPAFFWSGTLPVFSSDGPFTFTVAGPACVSVTDDFDKGDQFSVYDSAGLLGTTPLVPQVLLAPEVGPDAAFADPTYSSGTFVVGPGSHSITIEVTANSLTVGRGYLRVDSPGTPTYCENFPNLEVTSFSAPNEVFAGTAIGDQVELTVTNTGTADIEAGTAASIGFYVSADALITTGDELLVGGRENLVSQLPGGLEVGESGMIHLFTGAHLAGGSTIPEKAFFGVVLDEFDDVVEGDEADNTAAQAIVVSREGGSLIFTIQSLPSHGTLFDSAGLAITGVPFTLATQSVTFLPATGFVGTDSFQYTKTSISSGLTSAFGRIDLIVDPGILFGSCLTDDIGFCDDGR